MSTSFPEICCALCGLVFIPERSDEEALVECDALFGPHPIEELDIVCDDCFQMVLQFIAEPATGWELDALSAIPGKLH